MCDLRKRDCRDDGSLFAALAPGRQLLYAQRVPIPCAAPTKIPEDDPLQERVETTTMTDSTYRVTFERDDGQQYDVGARVTVHAMDGLFRTLALNPSDGEYLVWRCERICDASWKALRVSLHLVKQSASDAALAVSDVALTVSDATLASVVADDRR